MSSTKDKRGTVVVNLDEARINLKPATEKRVERAGVVTSDMGCGDLCMDDFKIFLEVT